MYVHIGTMTTGETVEEIERKLGWKPGTAKRNKDLYPEGDLIGPIERLHLKEEIVKCDLGDLICRHEYYTFK